MKIRNVLVGTCRATWLFSMVILAGVFAGDARSIASGARPRTPCSPREEASLACDAQVQTYEEDFSSYTHKAYTHDADWNTFEQRLTALPMSGGAYREPSIAPDGEGGAYVVWGDLRNNNSNGNWDIYAQRVDRRGNRLWAGDLRVNSDASETYQGIPAIAVDSQGDAIVVWVDDREDPHAVYAQKISAQGEKSWTGDVRVNGSPSYRIGWGTDSMAIALDDDDNVIVVWQGTWDDGWDPDVYAQKIDPGGKRVWPSDVQVNEDAGSDQLFMAVDVDAQGYIKVAWVDDRNGGEDIYAQRLDPGGNRTWPADVKVSAGTAIPHQGNPSVVADSQGNTAVVWRSGLEEAPIDQEVSTIYAQKIAPNGSLLWAGNVRVNQDTTHAFRGRPRTGLAPGDDVLVIWEDDRDGYGNNDVFAQRLSPAGAVRWSKDMPISPQEWWGVWKSCIRTQGNRAYVTWSAWDDVYVQFLDLGSESLLLPVPARINEADGQAEQYHADVSPLSGGRVLMAWADLRRGNWDIHARAVDLAGNMVWPNSFQVSDLDEITNQWQPRVATDGHDRSLVVWSDERGGIYGQLVDAAGNRRWTTDKHVNADNRWCLYPTVAAMPGDTFVVAWIGLRDGTSDLWDVFLQRVDKAGNRFWEHDRQVNSGDYYLKEVDTRSRPDVTVDAQGHLVVVWRGDTGSTVDVYVRRLSLDGTADWDQDLPLNSHISTRSWRSGATMCAVAAGNHITVAWVAYRDGQYGIYVQRLNLGGQTLWGPGVWVNSATNEVYYGNPDLALFPADDDVIVIWDDERNWRNVFAQRLDSSGHPVWPAEVGLNDFGAWPLHPSLSMETGGSFIAAWHDERYGDDSIYARRFDADGTLLWSNDLALIPSESYYSPAGVAESNTVDDTPDEILRASLTVSQTLNGGTVSYYLSNDGGQTWEEAVPGELHAFNNAGSDLRWKAVLYASEDRYRSPVVRSLTVRYGPDLIGDAYEMDDTCACAQPIFVNGTAQRHTFHDQADADWVTFDAISGTTYLVEAQVPTGSPADVALELYDQCGGLALASQDHTFSPGVRLEFEAPADGPLYVKLHNHDPTIHGPQVAYHLSVRAADDAPLPGALVLVAGRGKLWDPVQDNIHHVTDQVYQLFLDHDYDGDRITYLATDTSLRGCDALPTTATLKSAITAWAVDRVSSDRPFTLYMTDHGGYDRFDLDKPNDEWVTPQEVDNWLAHLEQTVEGVKVNVIIEACGSGSFIDLPQKVSRPGRVVIASTGARNTAWSSDDGAIFSDYFLEALGRKENLYASFQTARWATQEAHPGQTPWLDDDGDGIANEAEDGQEAARRGFAYTGTLPDAWPPYVVQATGAVEIEEGQGVIRAEVRDDVRVRRVWAVIYPPSYRPPEPGEELIQEALPTIVLLDQGSDWYVATYTGFDELGVYRVVVYAEDDDGLVARPLAITVRAGWQVYLPRVLR